MWAPTAAVDGGWLMINPKVLLYVVVVVTGK